MTREKPQKEKKRLLNRKPVMDVDFLTYQAEMAEWDAKLKALELEESKLCEQEAFAKLEMLGQIKNLERRRANRLESMELLKKQFYRIGMRLNRAKNYKVRQYAICEKIVEMEAEVEEFTATIDGMIDTMLANFK